MKKLNLAVVFILAVSLIVTFSFAGIASKAPEASNLKQSKLVVANPIELVSLKQNKTPEANVLVSSTPTMKGIDKNGTVTVNDLNIRTLGSMRGKVLIKVDKGTSLYVIREENSWYYVQFVENGYGWVYKKYVEFKKDPPPKEPELKKIEKNGYVTVNNLNVRNLGSMKGKIIASINKGRRIYVFGEKDGWYYIEYSKDKRAWVAGKYVEFRESPLPQTPKLTKIERNGYVTPRALNVRNLGSMNGKIITSLKQDTKIYVFGEKDGWFYVEYAKGKKGWVSDRFILFKDIDPVEDLGLKKIEKVGTVTVNGLNIRTLGSMKGKVLIDVDKGTSLYVYGEKNGWYYVEFVEHAFGWVYAKYVSFK